MINEVSQKGPGKFPTVEGQGRKLPPIVAWILLMPTRKPPNGTGEKLKRLEKV